MRKRPILFLAAGALVAAAILAARHSLSHAALASILQSPAPTEAAMEDYLATAGDPAVALHQLWDTARIPQRVFTLNALIRRTRNNENLWQQTRPIVLAAASAADSEMQSIALQLLFDHHDPQALQVASRMLSSVDPDVRVTGLMRLNDQHDKKWAAVGAALLQDADAKVQTIAAAGLRDLTGQDFGVHLSSDPTANMSGIAAWKTWWHDHAADFPAISASEPQPETSPGMAHPFTLPDLTGKNINLADLKGKVVLLNFWATWCPSCVAELHDLGELQRSHANDLVLIGINLDGVSDNDDHDAPPDAKALAQMKAEIENAVKTAEITYPTLLDPRGTTLGPYGAGALPVSILLGKDGAVKRRLLGSRTNAAWNAIIAEAAFR